MDPRVEAVVTLIELVRRLGVDHGPAKGEHNDHLGVGGEGDLRRKTPDGQAPGDHQGRPAPHARSPSSCAPRPPAAGGLSLARDLGVPDGAAQAQEAALSLQSLPGRERDPRRAEWEPARGSPRTAPAGASSLRDHIEKLVKNQCALHESQKSLQLAIRDLSGKVDVLASTIPSALNSITTTQTNLGKNLSYLGRQLSSMESTLDRFHTRTNAAGQLASTPDPADQPDLYPNIAGGFIFDPLKFSLTKENLGGTWGDFPPLPQSQPASGWVVEPVGRGGGHLSGEPHLLDLLHPVTPPGTPILPIFVSLSFGSSPGQKWGLTQCPPEKRD